MGTTKRVSYEKAMRERAKREKKFLVTVSVDGHEIKDAGCTVQGPADLKTARKVAKFAVSLFATRTAD